MAVADASKTRLPQRSADTHAPKRHGGQRARGRMGAARPSAPDRPG